MFTKLDKLIVKAFIGPFAATFFITLMVLVMQFFWLWIDDFVGKGLSTGVIMEFIWYQSAVLVPLALPLSVLLSSLMTFGNLGESYELVAVKAAGISLLRFMRPLFAVVVGICGIAFLFGNYIIPVANLKSRTLLGDIVYAKPAFDLKEGVFYNKLTGIAIKIGKKKNDSIIQNIIIYEKTGQLQDNFIVATDGIMSVSESKRFLQFNLKNGWRYQERAIAGSQNTEFIRLGFKEYKKQFDLSSLQFTRTSDSAANRSNFRFQSMEQLNKSIDSMSRYNAKILSKVGAEVFIPVSFAGNLDTSWKTSQTLPDSIKRFDQLIPDSLSSIIQQRAQNRIAAAATSNETLRLEYEREERELRRHKMEWHRKISLSLACLVLFIIGAPLGSIIRKGGLGNSMIFAIIFFMLFYFTSNSGEKFAKEGEWIPVVGMWFSTFILIPIGIFLTYKAVHDSQLFNKEYYGRIMRKLRIKSAKKSANQIT
ncbi:MAG: LptF/LptG family permease [Chitinophagaceae bacterium]